MGDVALNYLKGTMIEMKNHPSSSFRSASSTKVERKVMEKNRRNQMKTLFFNLNSLLPKHNSAKETLPLLDQIDVAINYIKSLEEKLKKSRQKKESLSSSRKRLFSDFSDSYESTSIPKAPQLQTREVGSFLEIVFISELDNQFIFYDIIRILHEEFVDIASASYSVVGNQVIHVVHAQMRESSLCFGGVKVTERLNRLVNGSTSEREFEPELWDFNDFQLDTWAL